MKKREFISYGFKYDPKKFEYIQNRYPVSINKPLGGLWGSPKDSEWGWKDWCEAEDFRKNEGLDVSTTFTLTDTAEILVLNSRKAYDSLPDCFKRYYTSPYGYYLENLDFETISREYDAILLTYSGLCELGNDFDLGFNTWDCESILVLNKDCIVVEYNTTMIKQEEYDY